MINTRKSGDLGGNRTRDNLIKSQVLYRLSYQITVNNAYRWLIKCHIALGDGNIRTYDLPVNPF